jgi:hypothetical protein
VVLIRGAEDPLTPQEIALMMKMGSWRVGRLVIPQIELLVSQIESAWREILPDLSPCDCVHVRYTKKPRVVLSSK